MTIPVWTTAADGPIKWPAGVGGDAARLWNTVTIEGLAMPGFARVSGMATRFDLQVKKTPGMDGATITHLGRDLAHFTVTVVLCCQDDLNGYEMMLPLLQPVALNKATGKQTLQAVTISHPALNMGRTIRSCCIEEISVLHPGAAIGTMEADLKCIEYRPAVAMQGAGTPSQAVRKNVNALAWNPQGPVWTPQGPTTTNNQSIMPSIAATP